MAYPDDLLVDGERVALHARPHWSTQLRPAAVVPLTAAVAGFLAAVVRLQSWAHLAWLALGVAGAVVVLAGTVLPLARWRATHIVVTNHRLLVREGLVARRGLDVPIDRIASVRTRRTPAERLFGSGTLIIDTDDAGDAEPMWFADVPRVERVQARLHREISRSAARHRETTGSSDAVATG